MLNQNYRCSSWKRKSSRCWNTRKRWRSRSRWRNSAKLRTPPATCSRRSKPSTACPQSFTISAYADGDFLQSVADSLKNRFKGVIVLGAAANGHVSLVAADRILIRRSIVSGSWGAREARGFSIVHFPLSIPGGWRQLHPPSAVRPAGVLRSGVSL